MPRPAVLLCAAFLIGCGPQPGTRHEVVARLGEPRAAVSPAGVAVAPLLIGSLTRHALEALPAPLEIRIDADVERIAFSMALRSGADTGAARFRVEARAGEAWHPVHAERLPAQVSGWLDRTVDLAPPARGSRHFRFSASVESGEPTPLWGSLAFLARPARERRERPNVIVLWLDTLGAAYLSSYGGPEGVTPNLDALLAQSFSFRRAYAQYSETLSSTVSLFTGLYPGNHGVSPRRSPGRFRALTEHLAADGYYAVAITEGGFVSARLGYGASFDHYDDGPPASVLGGSAPATFGAATRWLERFAADTRFLLFVHTYEVHAPYQPRDEASRELLRRLAPGERGYRDGRSQLRAIMRHRRGARLLPPGSLRRLEALHVAKVRELDIELGRFLARLSELGLERDTLLVVAADHGDQFGQGGRLGHGVSLHNRVIQVPLAFRWPARWTGGASRAPVQVVDILPTVLDLVGLPAETDVDGRSLAAAMRGEGSGPRRPAFSELWYSNHECERLGREPECRLGRSAVQTGRYKLVRSETPAFEVLYDLERDPLETTDVAAQQPDVLAEHRALLDAYHRGLDPPPEPAAAPALDDATRQRLQGLGYLE